MISTITPAVSMSCLDFAFLTPWKRPWNEKRGGIQNFDVLLGTQFVDNCKHAESSNIS